MRQMFPAYLVAASIAFAAPLAAQDGPGWQTYVDAQFGTRITYPAYLFTDAALSENGAIFTGPGTTLEVSSMYRPDVNSPAMLRQYMSSAAGYETVTYSPDGERWLVVSGYRGSDVFYEKFFLAGGTVQSFSFQYPIAERDLYDPVVEALEDSFRPGFSG